VFDCLMQIGRTAEDNFALGGERRCFHRFDLTAGIPGESRAACKRPPADNSPRTEISRRRDGKEWSCHHEKRFSGSEKPATQPSQPFAHINECYVAEPQIEEQNTHKLAATQR